MRKFGSCCRWSWWFSSIVTMMFCKVFLSTSAGLGTSLTKMNLPRLQQASYICQGLKRWGRLCFRISLKIVHGIKTLKMFQSYPKLTLRRTSPSLISRILNSLLWTLKEANLLDAPDSRCTEPSLQSPKSLTSDWLTSTIQGVQVSRAVASNTCSLVAKLGLWLRVWRPLR